MKKPRAGAMGWSAGVMVVLLTNGLVAGLYDVFEQPTSGKNTSTAVKSSQTELSEDFLRLSTMNEPDSYYAF
jgi:hypothetical protein